MQDDWPEFLRVLWREQHPKGHEQVALNFGEPSAPATNVMLFEEMQAIPARWLGRKKLAKSRTLTTDAPVP